MSEELRICKTESKTSLANNGDREFHQFLVDNFASDTTRLYISIENINELKENDLDCKPYIEQLNAMIRELEEEGKNESDYEIW